MFGENLEHVSLAFSVKLDLTFAQSERLKIVENISFINK